MGTWNKPCVLALTTAIVIACKGQFTPPSGEFYETLREKQEYFSVLRSQMTKEEFFQEGGEYAAFQRWLQFWQFRAPLGDRLNYDLLLKNYCDAHFTANGSYKSNSDPWHEIGPKGIANNMFGIGPVRHIAISKDNSEHMLCTSNSGGLFHTSDANATCTWHNGGTDLGLPRSGCSWADFYPGTTDNWYVLSGTRIAYLGGLYRTTNSGADWVRIADYTDLGGPNTDVLQFIFDRKLNFNGEHRLFLLTSLGMYVTDDPEATLPSWTPIQIIVPPSIPAFSSWAVDPNVLVYDIEYLASSAPTSTLCASMRFKLTNGSNTMHIWRFMLSTDDGETWTEAPNQPDIDPGIEWATVETSAASPTAFHCMIEKGSNSWVKLFDTTVNQAWPTLASNFNPDFGAGHTFGVDQFNANSLIVGDDLYDVNWYLNGAEVAYPYPPSPPAPRQYKYASTGHDDVEDIVGDPANPGIFWVANHGGVTRVNTNASPRTWEYKSEGLGVAEVWSMSTSQNKPDYVALGLYHQCNLITRTTYSEDWTPDWAYLNLYGDGTLALLDHKDASTLYYANQYGHWWRNDDSENSLTLGQDVSLGTNQYEYYAEGTLNRKQPNTLYRATKRPNGYSTVIINGNSVQYLNHEIEILRSFDKGNTNHIISDFRNDWEVTRSGINQYRFDNERVWWIRSNSANPKHLYAGLLNWDWQNRIYRTTIADHLDAQEVIASWHDVPHPRRVALGTLQRQQPPVGFAMDPENENIVYVAYASALFEDPDDFASPVGLKMVYRLDLSNLSAFPQSGPFDCDGGY
ncbi:MAG TPA: hypothetical protein PKY96_14010, partial [Flavobacteriales bacterium]|nr:hypothetical protein [Flavobacteriales bacterium]